MNKPIGLRCIHHRTVCYCLNTERLFIAAETQNKETAK